MSSVTGTRPSQAFLGILGRALIDVEFRDKLFLGPEAMGRQHCLSAEETVMLEALDRSTLESAAERLTERSEFAIGPGRWQGSRRKD